MTDDLHYIFLEAEKCHAGPEASLIEKVDYALYNFPTLTGKPEGFDYEIFDLLFSSADLNKYAPEDKIKYENDMTAERDIQNQIDYAQDKDYLLGHDEGVTEGKEEGEQEEQDRIVANLRAQGISEDVIAKAIRQD